MRGLPIPTNHKTSGLVIISFGLIGLCIAGWPYKEVHYEFDVYNMRTRSSTSTRLGLFNLAISCEQSRTWNHPLGSQLRRLDVYPEQSEAKSLWVLIKSYDNHPRARNGHARYIIRELGLVTSGTPTPLPSADLRGNLHIQRAKDHKQRSQKFWKEYLTLVNERETGYIAVMLFMWWNNQQSYETEMQQLRSERSKQDSLADR